MDNKIRVKSLREVRTAVRMYHHFAMMVDDTIQTQQQFLPSINIQSPSGRMYYLVDSDDDNGDNSNNTPPHDDVQQLRNTQDAHQDDAFYTKKLKKLKIL